MIEQFAPFDLPLESILDPVFLGQWALILSGLLGCFVVWGMIGGEVT